nr:E-beta-farnesene synthase [Tanacetum cinerariifolium]
MADVNLNVNAPVEQAFAMAPPTRTDDQIMPYSRWVPVGKSNCYLDVEKSQSNPIYKIAMDILKHANFFRAFTASSTIPSNYIQQDALQITPVNNNNPFSSPPTPDALINFVNNLGYPKVVRTLSNVVTNDMFQPWRALTMIINLCLTGKTLGFERPRASGNKKANPVVIPSIRFTKPIIHHLQSKHKFHPRPDSPLHLPYEEYILRYLKFSVMGTKQEVFGMPIPNEFITADIQGEQYYKEYLKKVAKRQRYLAGEKGSDPDSPAPKPTKATKKYKPSAPKAAPVTKPAAAQQSKPKPAPTKTQEKKHEFVDEGIHEKEPRFDDEEADMQSVVEESLKSVHDAHRGPLPPVVIREPDSEKFQPLPEVQEKGKKKEVPHVVKIRAQDEGQAGLNPGLLIKGQATDVLTQQNPEQMDEKFTATAYPNVHENLKLTIEEQVILEEPACFTGTLSSLQHLAKNFSFGDQFFNDKPSKAENKKITAKTKAKSMVSVTVQQDTSAIPHMTTLIIDLTLRPDFPNLHRPLQASATETTTTITTTHLPPPQPQQITTNSILIKHISELEQIMANLIQDKKHLEESPSGTLGSTRAFGSSQLPPPPPPSSTSQSDQSKSTAALSSSKTTASAEYTAWMTTDTRLRTSVSLIPKDLHMDNDTVLDEQVHSSDDEDIENAHIPKVNLQQDWLKPLEEDIPAAPESIWSIPSPDLPVTIQSNFFFNKDLEYLRYGSKGGRPAFSILKMKAAYYPDVGLEKMVPDLIYTSEGDHRAFRTHMRILSVVRIEFFSMYGYDYMKKIVLCRADLNEYIILERDFKYLYPSDFEDLYLLNLQGFEYKHDFTVIDSPRAVTFRDKYEVQMIKRFNEINKFSDGTLHQIDEALDYRVKEFKVNGINSGLNTRFCTRKGVDRSKEFMFAIQKRLKTRRIFCNLESIVGGRVREGDYKLLQQTE